MIQINVKGPDFSDGNCASIQFPDLFYPGNGQQERDGREMVNRICTPCKRRTECLQFALDHNETEGIWGGMTPSQRALLMRDQNTQKRIKTSAEVQRLVDAGLTLESACAEVGIQVASFLRNEQRKRAEAKQQETTNHEQDN